MSRKEKYLKSLSRLGKTKEEIANALFNLGIKGNPGYPRSCPIAKYLGSVGVHIPLYDNYVKIYAGQSEKFWEERLSINEYSDILIPIKQFIIAFDKGEFPNLISCGEPY